MGTADVTLSAVWIQSTFTVSGSVKYFTPAVTVEVYAFDRSTSPFSGSNFSDAVASDTSITPTSEAPSAGESAQDRYDYSVNLPNGDYDLVASVSQGSLSFTMELSTFVTVSGADVGGQDFLNGETITGTISGVSNGSTVQLSITDPEGNYAAAAWWNGSTFEYAVYTRAPNGGHDIAVFVDGNYTMPHADASGLVPVVEHNF
jgi:hypothetical protein